VYDGVSAKKRGVRVKRTPRRILNNVRMQTTTSAVKHLLCAIGDPFAEVREIGPGHPEYMAALILRASAGVIAKVPTTLPSIRETLSLVDRAAAPPPMLAHVLAAEAWSTGDPVLAAERYAAIVADKPEDLLALRLAQSCYFFLGWLDRFVALCDRVVRDWPGSPQGLQFALAMTSFGHAENGDAEKAEIFGRRALEFDNACPMGVHAVAHAFAESGRHEAGARWMREQRAQWSTESRMRTHNAWHLAMFDVECGDLQSALEILDEWLLPAIADSALEACDATALLSRLELEGVEVGHRWLKVSDAFERTAPGFWPFIDLHAGFAHARANQPFRAQRLTRAVADCAREQSYAGLRARKITLPGLAVFTALANGRCDDAPRAYARLEPVLPEAGGSRAQLDIFYRVGKELAGSATVKQAQSVDDDASRAA
jgi:hypothetical protein